MSNDQLRLKMIDRFLSTIYDDKNKQKYAMNMCYRVKDPIGIPVRPTNIMDTALHYRYVRYTLHCETRLYLFHFAPDFYEVTVNKPWDRHGMDWVHELSLGKSEYTDKYCLDFALNEILGL